MLKKTTPSTEIIKYIFFGVLTTLVNYLTFFIFRNLFMIDYRWSNFFAWFFSVLFAFVTNKLWVFNSHTLFFESLKEAVSFFWYRGLSLVLDMGMMILFISYLHWSEFLSKTLTQIVIIALNYVFSKWFVFKKEK